MAKLKDKKALWRPISKPQLFSSKMTGPASYQWPNLLIIMKRTLALVILFLNSTVAITHKPLTKKDVNSFFLLKSADELLIKLRKLMIVCRKKFKYEQKLQKQHHDKHTKPRSYNSNNKTWLNSKYLRTKCS